MKTVICCCHSSEGHAVGKAVDPRSAELLAMIRCDRLTTCVPAHGGRTRIQESDETFKVGFEEKDDWGLVAQWIA